MSRWIDADALTEKLKQHHDFFVEAWNGFKNMPIKDKARCDELTNCMAEIFNAPSIDIVRCKECEHSYEWDSGCGAELVCKARRCDPGDWGNRIEFYVKPDDFCSYGER